MTNQESPTLVTCPHCNGRKVVQARTLLFFARVPCLLCSGSGSVRPEVAERYKAAKQHGGTVKA